MSVLASPAEERSPWLETPRPRADPRLRVFCIPFAGGSASVFRDWWRALPRGVEVIAVELPGRGRRLLESPFSRLEPLVEALHAALAPRLDRPFALFGHSLGALTAFELTRRLRRSGAALPRRLFVSACVAPDRRGPFGGLHRLSDASLLAAILDLRGTPREVARDREFMDLVLPGFRADFELFDAYRFRTEDPLEVPITGFAGAQDALVAPRMVEAWQRHTAKDWTFRRVEGDHFFIQTHPGGFLPQLFFEVQTLLADEDVPAARVAG